MRAWLFADSQIATVVLLIGGSVLRDSDSDRLFELGDLVRALHDGLLHERLVPLELNNLFLHVVVLALLLHNASLQLLKVGHHVRVNHFDVLVVLRRQVILHEAYFLAQHLNLLFVLAEGYLSRLNPVLHLLAMTLH